MLPHHLGASAACREPCHLSGRLQFCASLAVGTQLPPREHEKQENKRGTNCNSASCTSLFSDLCCNKLKTAAAPEQNHSATSAAAATQASPHGFQVGCCTDSKHADLWLEPAVRVVADERQQHHHSPHTLDSDRSGCPVPGCLEPLAGNPPQHHTHQHNQTQQSQSCHSCQKMQWLPSCSSCRCPVASAAVPWSAAHGRRPL